MNLNIEMGVLKDGGVMFLSDRPLPHIVKRIEYYRDDALFMIVYQNPEHEGDLLHYEVPDKMREAVEKNPDVLIYCLFKGHEPIGYKVPLVQVLDQVAMVG